MVKWRTELRIPLALVTISVFTSNFVTAFESPAVPRPTVSSPTPSSISPGSLIAGNKRVPKQVGALGSRGVVNGKDHQQAETGYGHGHGHDFGHGHGHGLEHQGGHYGGDGKYFQYAHNPAYDEYEFGYRRGNDYHFQERYEKYGPAWNFKTKVKWGDKHGGYGEHYWDYNHAGSSHGDDGHGHGHGDGHYSEPVPSYEAQSSDKKQSMIAKRENRERELQKELQRKNASSDSKRTTGTAERAQDSQAASSRDSRNYRDNNRQSQIPRPRTTQSAPEVVPSLVLDPISGQVIDESTGKAYWLKPAN